MSRRPLASDAVNGHGAAAPQDAAQGHTAAQGLRASLLRLCDLHGQLASAYENLAREAEVVLAGLASPSLSVSVSPVPKLLTPTEMAELVGCDARTLRRMELEGRIPPPVVGEGRSKRWSRAEMDLWAQGETPGRSKRAQRGRRS